MPLDNERGDRPLVTDEVVEFEKWPVEVQDFRKITHRSRGIYEIHLKLVKKNRNITTRNHLDLETILGFWPIMRKISSTKGHFTHETESPRPLHFKHSHWWERGSRSKFPSHYAWGTNGVCECKMGAKSAWILTWHQIDHVSWSLGLFFKNHLFEVGLTQNRETMASRTLTTIGLFYFIMHEDPHE